MFSTYNLCELGKSLKEIREDNRMTQREVSQRTGIHMDTLRKIEHCLVIPKYESLELLSYCYKKDLLELLKLARQDAQLIELYEALDEFVLQEDSQLIEKVEGSFYSIKARFQEDPSLVDLLEIEEMEVFIKSIKISIINKEKAKALIVEILTKGNNRFDMNNLSVCRYTLLQIRLLMNLARIESEASNWESSNSILAYISENIKANHNRYYFGLSIKGLTILVHNFIQLKNYEQVIYYAQKGIDLLIEKSSMYHMEKFLYWKGIAFYMLGRREYREILHQAYTMLEVKGNLHIIEQWEERAKKDYGIGDNLGLKAV